MVKFLFYFILLVGLLGAGGLAAWATFEWWKHRRGRHRHRRHHFHGPRPVQTDWRPIATFPPDDLGTSSVLLWADGDVRLGRYDFEAAGWREQVGDSAGRPISPTFWMPLPHAPDA